MGGACGALGQRLSQVSIRVEAPGGCDALPALIFHTHLNDSSVAFVGGAPQAGGPRLHLRNNLLDWPLPVPGSSGERPGRPLTPEGEGAELRFGRSEKRNQEVQLELHRNNSGRNPCEFGVNLQQHLTVL